MNVVVLADDNNWKALNSLQNNVKFIRVNTIAAFFEEKTVDAYFNLLTNSSQHNYESITKPVFINSVVETLQDINAPNNIIRINAWASFIEKEIWEIAGNMNTAIENVLNTLNKKFILLPDIAGFVSARTIAMIINEAYFALADGVSTMPEIDIAMKLGTNYPYGPFEWADKIGLQNIFALLVKLSMADERYLPSNNIKEKLNLVA